MVCGCVDYFWIIVCFISYLKFCSDGTHSLQRIHWWATFLQSVPIKKQPHLHFHLWVISLKMHCRNNIPSSCTGKCFTCFLCTLFYKKSYIECITLWMCQVWVVQCPPGHTSSTRWRDGTERVCRGHHEYNPAQKPLRFYVVLLLPVLTAAPDHTRSLR